MIIKIKYHTDGIELEKLEQGDWIDLKAAETVELKQGEDKLISLGISMELPKGYEAHIVPRSSTFKKWGVLQVNSKGIIDEFYKGPNDVWGMWVIAMRDTIINKGDRICQFRIMEKQPEITFVSVASLDNRDRGGFGSTG